MVVRGRVVATGAGWLRVVSAVAVMDGRDSAAASKQQKEEGQQQTGQGEDVHTRLDGAGLGPGAAAVVVIGLHGAQCDRPVTAGATSDRWSGHGTLVRERPAPAQPRSRGSIRSRWVPDPSPGSWIACGVMSEDPHRTATDAAEAAGVTIVDGATLDHDRLSELADLFGTVWGRDVSVMGTIVSAEVLWAAAHVGSPVAAAWDEQGLVGGTCGFAGVRDGVTRVHSHLAGVLPRAAGRGIGRAMKWHQRAWCLDRGIEQVEWTFDPLVRRNAVLNLVHLGARPAQFLPDLYGAMADERNAGLPTHRFLVRWDLHDARVVQAAGGRTAEPRLEGLRRSGAEVVLDEDERGHPVTSPSSAPRRLARVPADVEEVRRDDPETAAAWSHALHDTVGAAMQEGMRVTGVTRDGWYVLARVGGVAEMA